MVGRPDLAAERMTMSNLPFKMKPAASYVATFLNDADSGIDVPTRAKQRELIQEEASRLGYGIVNQFEDELASSKLGTRRGFAAMIASARDEGCNFEAIIVSSLDRFSQLAAEQVIHVSQLEAYGIKLIRVA